MRQFILGIDISKAYDDVYLIGGEAAASGRFNNDMDGFRQLKKWLKQRKAKEVRACLEATGRYGHELALWLHQQAYKVSIINPTRIKKYGESKLQCNKTDKADAKLIADFCLTQEPT